MTPGVFLFRQDLNCSRSMTRNRIPAMTAEIRSDTACEQRMPVYPAKREARTRTARKTTPWRLMESKKEPVDFPKDWNTIVRRRTMLTQGVVMT